MMAENAEADRAENSLAHLQAVKTKYEAELLKKANVVAVGIGIPIRDGQPMGKPCIIVSVTHKVAAMELAAEDLVPRELEEVRVWVEEVGLPHVE